MVKSSVIFVVLFSMAVLLNEASAGPFTYAACQTGCNAVAVACYSAAGVTMGTITFGLGTPLAVMGCAAAQGACMAGCAALLVAPTP